MALSLHLLSGARKGASKCSRIPVRCLTTEARGTTNPQKSVFGVWKGFQAPAWSVEETLLRANSASRVSASDVKRIANLSYLHIEDHKVESLTKDMNNILKSVAAMEEIDTTDVLPLLSILEDYKLKTRPDIVRATTENSEDGPLLDSAATTQSQNTEEEWGYVEIPEPKILDNASHKEMGFFVVPKQKQPWEEETIEEEGDDVKPLREAQKRL
jgi:aspartyl/glutamyl-tRNA(Asn/Gln) amidotransferase C subunit